MKMASRSIDLISKIKLQVQHALFFLISKKTNMHVQHAFCPSLPLFCPTTTLFRRTKTSNFLVTHFCGGIVACAYPIFCLLCSCSLFSFTAAHFHLVGHQHFSLSDSRFEFSCFSSKNSPLLFSITRSSSFSVIHVSINIRNSVEKDTTLLLFFLFKSPGGHAISFQIKPNLVPRAFPSKTFLREEPWGRG